MNGRTLPTKRFRLLLAVLAVLAISLFDAIAALAERPSLSDAKLVEEAEVVVTGRVVDLEIGAERSHIEAGFGNFDWAIDLTIEVDEVAKGTLDALEEGEPHTVVVRCFRIKSRKSLSGYLTPSGNHPIPDVGADVLAHLYEHGGRWRVVFPNGLTSTTAESDLADADSVASLSNGFTYGLPIEYWVAIVLVGVLIVIAYLIFRRSRRPDRDRP